MASLTVTAKGQVTLRKDVLRHLGVEPGDKVAVDKLPDGRLEIRAAHPTGMIADVFNALKQKKGAALSIADIDRIAAEGWTGKR
jgi:AbrB family looped-hinge helix DNA binding protein